MQGTMQDCYTVRGMLSEIQRYSVHDGPGIRSLVFLMGCPLRCRWCCNPENISGNVEVMTVQGEEKTVGGEVAVSDIMDIVLKDRVYYRRSSGGVTLSGGEALAQPEFAKAILVACKDNGIHTAVETSAYVDYAVFESILPHLDYAMVDIKHVDDEKHQQFTGVSNRLILDNARRLGTDAKTLVIRVPVIPTFNDTEEEIEQIARAAAQIPNVKKLHLLPYHRLGEGKYAGLGWKYELADLPPHTPEYMQGLLQVAQRSGLHCQIGG